MKSRILAAWCCGAVCLLLAAQTWCYGQSPSQARWQQEIHHADSMQRTQHCLKQHPTPHHMAILVRYKGHGCLQGPAVFPARTGTTGRLQGQCRRTCPHKSATMLLTPDSTAGGRVSAHPQQRNTTC